MRLLVTSVCALIFLGCTTAVEAATLYLDPSETDLYAGDTITISVRLDTAEGECVNAVDGTISFSPEIVPVDISLGESIFPVWIEPPTIEKSLNRVTFAGGIPNGYCGRIQGDPRLTNVLMTLVVQAPTLPTDPMTVASISFTEQTMAYLNDGNGTRAQLQTFPAEVFVYQAAGAEVRNQWLQITQNDQIPPSQFSVVLSQQDSVFTGDYFVVFNTTDKQSGISHYEIMEEPLDRLNIFNWGGADAPWITAKSPYKLRDQTLNSIVRVKAIDKAGNETIAVYIPDETQRGVSPTLRVALITLGIALFIIMILLGAMFSHRRRRASFEPYERHSERMSGADDTKTNDDISHFNHD